MRVNSTDDDGSLNQNTINMLSRMSANIPLWFKVRRPLLFCVSFSLVMQKDYEEDFITSKPSYSQYLTKLQHWREKFEKSIDSAPAFKSLAAISSDLAEFQYTKADEIEIPGQYLQVRIPSLLAHSF